MFGFLKKKLKDAVNKFTKDVDEESEKEDVVVEKKVKKPAKKKPVKKKEVKKPKKAEKKKPKKEEKKKEKVEEVVEEPPQEEVSTTAKNIDEVNEMFKDFSDDDLDVILDMLGCVTDKELEDESTSDKIVSIAGCEMSDIKAALKKFEEEKEKAEEVEEEPEEEDADEDEADEVEEESEEEDEEETEEAPEPEKKGFFAKLKDKFVKSEEPEEESDEDETEEDEEEPTEDEESEEEQEEAVDEEEPEKEEEVDEEEDIETEEESEEETEDDDEEEEVEEPKEKKGFFAKLKETITTTKLSEQKFNDLFWELEVVLLENNVAVEVIEKIKEDLKKVLVNQNIPRGKLEEQVITTLRSSVEDLFDLPQIDLLKNIKEKTDKPYIIAFVGINGSGKTTSIAKVCHMLMKEGKKPVLAAADTFRAAAIQQLEEHGEKLGVKVIKHDYGSDPAAVAFDAVKYAKSKGNDVVLIDTAGRMHSNVNLMDEMEKIVRVAKPDLKIFVGESITGNDCTEQAKSFNETITFDGIILTKADVDDKGGAALSVSYITKKPILFFGVGQTYDDLETFNKEKVIENIGL